MSDQLPNPGPGPAIEVGTTVVRFAVAQLAGLAMQLVARFGLGIDQTQIEATIWFLGAAGWLAIARWRETRGIATKMLGIAKAPTYQHGPPKR